jgi:hypothetical protein
MTKATDKVLGELHGKLAKSMLAALAASETAARLLEDHGEELPGAVQAFLVKTADSNPALLTAVAKFLKDNSITCAIEDNDEMSELEQRLQNKKKRVGNVIPIDG